MTTQRSSTNSGADLLSNEAYLDRQVEKCIAGARAISTLEALRVSGQSGRILLGISGDDAAETARERSVAHYLEPAPSLRGWLAARIQRRPADRHVVAQLKVLAAVSQTEGPFTANQDPADAVDRLVKGLVEERTAARLQILSRTGALVSGDSNLTEHYENVLAPYVAAAAVLPTGTENIDGAFAAVVGSEMLRRVIEVSSGPRPAEQSAEVSNARPPLAITAFPTQKEASIGD